MCAIDDLALNDPVMNTLQFVSVSNPPRFNDAQGVEFVVQGVEFVVQGVEFVAQGVEFVVQGIEFVVQGVEFVVQGVEFVVQGVEFVVQVVEFVVQGSGCRVCRTGFRAAALVSRVQGAGCRGGDLQINSQSHYRPALPAWRCAQRERLGARRSSGPRLRGWRPLGSIAGFDPTAISPATQWLCT